MLSPNKELMVIDWTYSDSAELREELAAVVERVATYYDTVARRYDHLSPSDGAVWDRYVGQERENAAGLRRTSMDTVEQWVAAVTCGGPDKVRTMETPHALLIFDELGRVRPGRMTAPALWLLESSMMPSDSPRTRIFLSTLVSQIEAGSSVPLLEVIDVLDEAGFDGVEEVLGFQRVSAWPILQRDAATERHVERVATAVTKGRRWALPALGRLAAWPQPVLTQVTAAGLEGGKALRPLVQQLLIERGAEHRPQVIDALGSRRAPVRLEAARWLAADPHPGAVAALEDAFATEKQDAVIGALLDALVAAGRPVANYLRLDTLVDQATRALAQGPAKELRWVAWEVAPSVRWADGSPVDLIVVQWLATMAVRSTSARPGALVRAYAALWNRGDANELGLWLLREWLAADVAPIDPAEAHERAARAAASQVSRMTLHPHLFGGHPHLGWSVEQITAALLLEVSTTPAGSTTSSQGLLGLVAATTTTGAAPLVKSYLTQWSRSRITQSKALITMLGWIDDRAATALLLSIASRFRSPSLSDAATRAAHDLAERQGWTIAELEDRSVPLAGTDEHGVLTLSYGARTFTARVTDDLVFSLSDQNARPIKTLPAPRAADDPDAVKAAKRTLTAAKRELKDTVATTRLRLYEAMLAGRSWTGTDWYEFIVAHPIVGTIASRLLWQVVPTDGPAQVVRPLTDGTITDVDDSSIEIAHDAQVRVAHSSTMTRDEVARWSAHLADYEVPVLFNQLTRSGLTIATEPQATTLTGLRGSMLTGLTFRWAATKLGYQRGEVGDSGWLIDYRKRFPALGMTVVLGFTGNTLPEEDRPVAITEVSFHDADGPVPLAQVPPILLSETHADAVQIAAAGTGFDKDWETTTAW